MKIIDFLDYLREDFSTEKLENNENSFFEHFFYYKRNMLDFLKRFKTYGEEDQRKITRFLLRLYPLSDKFIFEILKENEINLLDEISVDSINFICNKFSEDFGDLNINFDLEIRKKFKQITNIKNIISEKEDKISKLLKIKKEFFVLKEKKTQIEVDIQDLESGNISSLRSDIARKKRKFEVLKIEAGQIKKEYQKVEATLKELDQYEDLKNKLLECREIIQKMELPTDSFSDLGN